MAKKERRFLGLPSDEGCLQYGKVLNLDGSNRGRSIYPSARVDVAYRIM